MDARDPLNAKLFSTKTKQVLEAGRLSSDARVDEFLKALQKVLAKELPPAIRAQKVSLVGSYLLNTTVEGSPAVDLHVVAPASACSADDVRRHGWVAAREKYLTALCSYLRDTHSMVASIEACEDSFNRTVLTIVGPAVREGENWMIRLHAGLNLPSLLSHFTTANAVQRSPFYSQLVLRDALTPALYESLHASLVSVSCVPDIAVLLRVWATKQGLCSMPDGLSYDVLHAVLHHLVRVQSLTEGMSPEQGFRLVLQFLASLPASLDLSPHPGNQLRGQPSQAGESLRSALLEHAPAVLEFSGWNVWSQCTEQSRSEVQQAARDAVAMLDTMTAADAIEHLFRIPSPFWLRFDMYIALPLPQHVRVSYAADATPCHDASYSVKRDFAVLVHTLLKGAIGKSITRCRCRMFDTHAVFGIGLESTTALSQRTILGPPLVERQKADEFAKKWGTRAKTLTNEGIVRRAALFTEAKDDYEFVRLLLACLLRDLGVSVVKGLRVLGQGATHCLEVESKSQGRYDPADAVKPILRKALLELTSFLETLDDFPVKVVHVRPAHAALRSTAVAPPHPHASLLRASDPVVPSHLQAHTDNVEAMELVMEFAHTSAWPEHKEAIDNIKTALYCKIAQRLRKERRLVSIPRRDCADVLINGLVFRLYVFHPREVLLLQNIGFEPQAAALNKQLHLLPQHSEMVSNYARYFRDFSAATRLLKRWAAVHFIADYVTEEALELIMCKIFSKAPLPMSALTGLARALHLISSWPWEDLAVVVPPYTGDRTGIHFKRREGPLMWFNTPYDSQLSPFTTSTPNATMLTRLRRLSEASLKAYFAAMSDFTSPETWEAKWSAMFTTSMKPFDLLITLSKDVIKNAAYNPANKRVLGDTADVERHPKGHLFRPGCDTRREELHRLINYNPVSWYIAQLRAHFRDHAMFAHDPYGGHVVGVVGLRAFTAEEAQALAEHFQGMGRGIVKRVQVATALQEEEAEKAASPAQAAAKSPKAKPSARKAVAKKAAKRKAEGTAVPEEAVEAVPAAPAAEPAAPKKAPAKKGSAKKAVKRKKVAA